MKVLFLVFAFLCIASIAFGKTANDVEVHRKFAEFMKKHNKNYSTDEEFSLRLQNFRASLERIEQKNKDKRHTATYGINKFSDMSPEEFRAQYLMPKGSIKHRNDVPVLSSPSVQIPPTFDWRAKGAVTPVKNQAQCGSCWAFSVTENVESVWILAGHGTNQTVDLAPQQIVDCDQQDLGCNGGDPPTAYEYIINAGGLESEADYPYEAVDQQCAFNASKVVARISNWKYATSGRDENTLQQNLVNWSPLSVCVDAANWQDYTGGVMGAWECAWIVQLDHCVQLVGYDTTASTPYYIVRNSWDTDWGINGFIYLEMNANTCGISEEATSSVA